MAQYIPKEPLVAEIERRMKLRHDSYKTHRTLSDFIAWEELEYFKEEFLPTLEVKEADLEKETKRWWKEHLHLNPENKLWMDAHQSVAFAKHFFELGLKAQKEGE